MKKALAALVGTLVLTTALPAAQAATDDVPVSPTAVSALGTSASTPVSETFALTTTAQSPGAKQSFTVTAEADVVITTTWSNATGSNKTSLYKDGNWVTDTGYWGKDATDPAVDNVQTIKRRLAPGTYQVRVEGDKAIDGTKTVTVAQSPIGAPTGTLVTNSTDRYAFVTTPKDRGVRQYFTVEFESDVVITTAWSNATGSNKTSLYKDGNWVTDTGFVGEAATKPAVDNVKTIKRRLAPGKYQLRLEGDHKLSGTKAVTVAQTPVVSGAVITRIRENHLLTTTPQAKGAKQSFTVPVESDLVITTTWGNDTGLNKTSLYKGSTWVTDTGYVGAAATTPVEDNVKTIKRRVAAGTYQVRIEGDTKLSGTKNVSITQTPAVATPAVGPKPAPSAVLIDKVVPRMPTGAAYLFGPTSEWKRDISQAPLAANSAAASAHLAGQVSRYYGAAALNVYQYNSPWYQVPADQPKVDVKFSDCQKKGYTPNQLFKPVSTYDTSVPKGAQVGGLPSTMPGHFTGVPIPADAVPAKGTDKALVVYSPSTDQLWEFWVTEKRADGWYACWGGRIDQVSKSRGYFLNGMGTSATGLASAAGAIGIDEAKAGSIDHALSLIVPETQKNVFSWPAQRTDGTGAPSNALVEGQRLRLDPTYDVDASKLHPMAKMVAKAAQTYGIIITDKGGAVSFVTEDGTATKKETGVDPWLPILTKPGATKVTPTYEVFKNFPWDRVQVLPKDYGQPK